MAMTCCSKLLLVHHVYNTYSTICIYIYIYIHTYIHTFTHNLQDIDYDYDMLLNAAPGAPRVLNFEKRKDRLTSSIPTAAKRGSLIIDPLASDAAEESAKSVLARMDDGILPLKGVFQDSRVFFPEADDADEWWEYDEGDETRTDDQTQTQTQYQNGGSNSNNSLLPDEKKKGDKQKSAATGSGKSGAAKNDDKKKKKNWASLMAGGQAKEETQEDKGNGLDVLDIGS